jgi:hypothetical protein
MRDRAKTRGHVDFPAATFGVRPGDFPVGSVESRAAARALISGMEDERDRNALADLGPLSEVEKALIDEADLDPLTQSYIVRCYRIALDREEVYGKPLPKVTLDEIRRNRAAALEKRRLELE